MGRNRRESGELSIWVTSGGKFLALFESAQRVRMANLPDDMQVLVSDLWWSVRDDDPPDAFSVVSIPAENFPEPELDSNRGKEYALSMEGDLPPVVISNGTWLDGNHRVYRAKRLGLLSVSALDLGLDWPSNLPSLGKVK